MVTLFRCKFPSLDIGHGALSTLTANKHVLWEVVAIGQSDAHILLSSGRYVPEQRSWLL
jgi:hypothetical protein